MAWHVKAVLALVVLLASWMGQTGSISDGMFTVAYASGSSGTPEEQREEQIIKRFLDVLEKNPRRGTALDRIYGYHVERGSLDQLIRTYRQRAQKDKTDGTASMIVGLLESQRGKDAEAVAAFRQAEKRLPQNPLASYYLGQALVMVGQPDAAAEAFERAIARKPGRTDLLDIFQALGRVYQRAQRSDKALAVWTRLEQLFPDDRRVQEQIASTLAEEGQYDQALPRYEKLAREARDPYQKATFRMEAAELKVRLKQTAKALADFEALLGELNPDSWLHREVRRKIEDVFLRNDDQAGLAKYYQSWVEKHPSDIDAIARLARALSAQGRMPEARSWLEKGIAKAPSRRPLRQALIEQLIFEQKYGEAATQYEAMDKADPNNPDTLREWGKVLLRDKARPEAERKQAAYNVWKRLLDKRPKDPVITAQVADLLRGAGMSEEAIALYKRAIELAPQSPQYREYLGEYYHSLKRSSEALATWRPMAEGANRNAKNLARLGEVFNGFGYRKEAVAAFAEAVGLDKDDFNLRLRYAELLELDERHDDALAQIDTAEKLASNADEAEAALQARIKIYQSTDTLTKHTDKLREELDAGKDATAERWHRLARYYEANRQMAEATAAIGQAIKRDGKSIPILASAARIHESGGNLLLAADINRQLAALDRRFRTEYLTTVAKLEVRLGRRAEALQAGRDLLAAAPGNPDHYKFFAELCFELGESTEGLESLRRSVRANPSDPQGLLTLANALAELPNTGEAIELFWRAFDKTDDLDGKLPIIARLTELYLQNNQFDRLLERLERERREADKQREMTLCLAQAYQTAGDLGTARQQLERLLTENSRDTQLLQQLSKLAENEGDTAGALKYQRQWAQAAPNSHEAQLGLAQLLVKAGESEEAAAIWVKLVADEPQPHRNLQAIDSLLAHGKADTVLAITRRLLAQNPANWEVLYREGVALAELHRQDEAAQRFQTLLDLHLSDDEEGAVQKALKKQKPGRAAGRAISQISNPFYEVPLLQRTGNVWQIRAFTGLDPRYGYYVASQQHIWTPNDYGQARMAALAWQMRFAQKKNRSEEFVKARRPLSGGRKSPERAKTPGAYASRSGELRALWDWYYLQLLRQDLRETYQAARELARSPDPAAQWTYLHSLSGRLGTERNRPASRTNVDTTLPLPADEIERVLASFQLLRKEKPQWLTTDVLTNVLAELKRARRTNDEERIYREAVTAASQNSQPDLVQQILNVAAARGDVETVLQFFERLEKLQGNTPRWRGMSTIRQTTYALSEAMRARADAKDLAAIPRLYEAYVVASRRQHQASGRRASSRSLSAPQQHYYAIWTGRYRRGVSIDFPQPNDYLDEGAIELLRNAYEFYKRGDVLSDLFGYFRKKLDSTQGADAPRFEADKILLHLTLAALHWWEHEREQALNEMNAASQLAPTDVELRLELARLRENNNEPHEALAILESLTPQDHTTMQRREAAALRLAVRTGNVERARQAADRLFGLRLDAETQVQLAAQMHQLGMHDAAEKVMARAQRQAGQRTAALISLMHQYQNQNQVEMAVQIARRLLRKGPSMTFRPYYYQQENEGRTEAIQVLVRTGKLPTLIERTEVQLKSAPRSLELHQTLLEYYKAAGDKNKVKDIALRMSKIWPDDAKVQYQIAQQLREIGEWAAAADRYRDSLRKDPSLFAYNYWEIQQVFDQAHKTEELIQLFDEIDLKSSGSNCWVFMNMLEPLFNDERTRARGMKFFRKIWDTFPQERIQLMGYLYHDAIWQLPEIYDYARQAVIPRSDEPVADPWRSSEQVILYSGNGRVEGFVTRLLKAAQRQNRLRLLGQEIEQVLSKRPEWSDGKALLAMISLKRGKVAEARRLWRQLLDDKQNPMPTWSRVIFGQELRDYESMHDLALETFEGAAEEIQNEMSMDYQWNPIRQLVELYRETGRKEEARTLMLKLARSRHDESYDPGYAAYRRIENTTALANSFTEMGYPIDALRLCSELLDDHETLEMATTWYNGPHLKQQTETALRNAFKGLTPATLAEAVHDVLTPRPESNGRHPPASNASALDLLLLVRPHELPKAQLTSLLERALDEAVRSHAERRNEKEPRMQAEKILEKLLVEHPRDLSVQIAAALLALAEMRSHTEDGNEKLRETIDRLTKLTASLPLEKLEPGKRANARQRAEAAQQIGLWLVARACLRYPSLRAASEQLGQRAVEAARRQLEPHFALAILREWGQIELDRGDRKAAEQRWGEMLDVLLPQRRQAGEVSPPVQRKTEIQRKTGRLLPPTRPLQDSRLVFALAPPITAPQAAGKVPSAPDKLVLAVTTQQFDRAAEIAKMAAEHKMLALSLQAIRDALGGGPPVNAPLNIGRVRRVVRVVGSPNTANENDPNQHNQVVANQLNDLVARWRREGAAETDIYETLAEVVLPAGRPGEVFLYVPATLHNPAQPALSAGRLLAESALRAGRLDDLRRRITARLDKPLAEWNARILLAQTAWAAKDEARLRELLKEFEQRLQKDTLQHTAALICHAVAPLLSVGHAANVPGTQATCPGMAEALPVLDRAAKNLSAAGDTDAAANVLLFLAHHDFERGKTKEGRARLKEVIQLHQRNWNRNTGRFPAEPGNNVLSGQIQNVAWEYIHAGLLSDALDLLGTIVDLPMEQQAQVPKQALFTLTAAFARHLLTRPAAERYELLKNWTLPTPQRRSVRILGAFVSTEMPPAAFGIFPREAWQRGDGASGVLSTPALLIDAAREAGKLDELAAEVRSLTRYKVRAQTELGHERLIENADVFYALIQITRGQGAAVEDIVKQRLEQLRKKMAAPPPIRSPYYGGPQQPELQVEWPDYLLARAGLRDAALTETSRALAEQLYSLAQRTRDQPAQVHLREEMAQSRCQHTKAPELQLPHWHPGGYVSAGARRDGPLPARWVAHEGHIAHLLGPDHQFLIFDYPLIGTFEFSVDAYHGGWAEGHLSYAGMVFEPNPGSVSRFWPVGCHEQIPLPGTALQRDSFNRFTVQVTSGKLRWLVNGRLVHEQTDPSPTSPWLALYASRERHTVFRNPQLVGTPQIPRQVRLSHGDRLEGWVSSFYQESQPRRLNKQADDFAGDAEEYLAEGITQKQQPSSFDWYARDGEIHGHHARDLSLRREVGSLLAYFRPLRPGETLSYEFFYRPDEVMVHPSLGRLVFLLEPQRVRLHWLVENDGNDWTGLTPDNAVPLPFSNLGEGKARMLRANEWNRLQLSLNGDKIKIEVNGVVVCERKLEANDSRTFGLFHYKNRTAAQVRNVVLTGNWPDKLSEKEIVDSFRLAGPASDGAVRRALIGESFFLRSAGLVLKQARELPPEQAYKLLQAWVLPNRDHSLFQMAGEFTPTDPAPPLASKPLPPGRRVQTGGNLEAPALELAALAKKLDKLDDLVSSVQKADTPEQARGRWAMLALLRAAQERDDEAQAALSELTRLITPLPVNEPMWQRWPELVAAVGTRNRPALRSSVLALLDAQVKKLEQAIIQNISLPDRDLWIRHVRQARAAAQVLGLPEKLRVPFGTDPNLRYWDAVSHSNALPRGLHAPRTHWSSEGNVVRHYPGRAQDYLYLRVPLVGDFEASCDLTSFGWREAHLGYGGLRFDLLHTLKRYNLHSFSHLIRSGDIEPPLPPLGPWYQFRLVVRSDTYTVYVNDRKICEEPLPDDADPWLVLHADHQCTAGIRNLKISGQPRVPESLSLSTLPDLTGWISYDGGPWQKRGDTIIDQGGRPETRSDRPSPRTWQERALHYHRPLLEDGEIEYDFFYEPGKEHGHPVLDRLVLLLDPEGVRIHWLTDGAHDRTGLTPDNVTTEPNNRRGPAVLPLKPKTWNHVKLSLSGDTIVLHLNDTVIYERVLESTNQRNFGLFHYADETTLRVRNVIYRGQWPRRLPDAEELWARK
jgi:tetratricopeptide (TPR) repeat protein